jgi:hypothetical protein
LLPKESSKSNNDTDLFKKIRKEITVMRKQGESPEKDPGSFARYMCDLCNSSFPIAGLKQCVLCGRWACESCWKDEFYTCRSCAGIIALHQVAGKK